MATFSNYISTAMKCSSYSPIMSNSLQNITDEPTSCLYCKHFKHNHCTLDKYDQINHNAKK